MRSLMKSYNQISCLPSNLLNIEMEQCLDEGKSAFEFESEILLVKSIPDDRITEREQRAMGLFLKLQHTPITQSYPYFEPSSWDQILDHINYSSDDLIALLSHYKTNSYGHILGGILGKCIGCLLGKPVEGWKRSNIVQYMQETNNLPLAKYLFDGMHHSDYVQYGWQQYKTVSIKGMPEDDDINYLLVAFKLIKQFGIHFKSSDVAMMWLDSLPIYRLCTGERIAYRNFVNGIFPPESAVFCNPYREWIGAQIRTDLYGYINPGNPVLAMKLAWTDASVSHSKNGIYGGLWIAVILSLIPVTESIELTLLLSLNFIPNQSRFHKYISDVLSWYRNNLSLKKAINNIHDIFSEHRIHHWCHVLPNAMIVAIALLWGKNDFELSLQIVLTAGFDTDSNGASVGSILGYAIGADRISHYWKNVLQNRIESSVLGETNTNISELAKEVYQFSLVK